MKEILQEVVKRTSASLIILGIILLILGASGGFTVSNFSLQILEVLPRVTIILVGIILVGFGIFLIWRDIRLSDTLKNGDETNPSIKNDIGVESISIGTQRSDAFQKIMGKAKNHVAVVGIGMSNVSRYARQSLDEIGKKVPIDFLMIDPEMLSNDPGLSKTLDEFLDFPNFATYVQESFTIMKSYCENWNADTNHKYKMSLRVYRTIPTMSMVMIDSDEPTGEMTVEFFPYKAGQYRPRMHVKKLKASDGMFEKLKQNYLHLWNDSRKVV